MQLESQVVREGTIEEAVACSKLVPELINPPGKVDYLARFSNRPNLILLVYVNGQPACFKVAYERDGYCYSWLGGTAPEFRRKGLAKDLALEQESWARKQGYTTITMKTRNTHRNMLLFALQNDFIITGFDVCENKLESRIWLQKKL